MRSSFALKSIWFKSLILWTHGWKHRKVSPGSGILFPGKVFIAADTSEAKICTRGQAKSHGPLLTFSFLGILLGISCWHLLWVFNSLQHGLHNSTSVRTQRCICERYSNHFGAKQHSRDVSSSVKSYSLSLRIHNLNHSQNNTFCSSEWFFHIPCIFKPKYHILFEKIHAV